MPINEKCKVLAHDDAGPGYRFLVLDAPRLAAELQPGQFVHVKVPTLEASALRRPFSVFDAEDGKVTILYKRVGRGTEALAAVPEGGEMDVLGPLGRGSRLNAAARRSSLAAATAWRRSISSRNGLSAPA